MSLTRLALLTTLALVTAARAIDPVPLEKAQEGARKLNESLPQTGDFAVQINPDLEKPQAVKSGEIGLMVVADQSLASITAEHLSETPVAVGQLWAMNVVVAKNGQASSAEQQRTVTLHTKDQDVSVNLYLLGAVKNGSGAYELVVFGKDKEPLARAPLQPIDNASQSLPIEMDGEKQDEETGRLTLSFLGKQKAELTLKRMAH